MSAQLQGSIKSQQDRRPGKGRYSVPTDSRKDLHRERQIESVDYTEFNPFADEKTVRESEG